MDMAIYKPSDKLLKKFYSTPMKKAAILGHFALGTDKANGQTIKTKIVGSALQEEIGKEQVDFYDTMGGWKFLIRMPWVMLRMLWSHRNIIIMPAYVGVHLIAPLIVLLNLPFRRKLHYVVIGGWLPSYLRKYFILRLAVRKMDVVYVETRHMLEEIEREGFKNVKLMPNFKALKINSEKDLQQRCAPPFPLCTFSRVMKEKGIEDAIFAVNKCNGALGDSIFTLDIYGLVEEGQEEWFEQLMSQQPKEIKYCGVAPFDKSTEVLGKYFALLFPTRFQTEGFAGTLIDAMSAGVPPIASDCPSNKELIADGQTGLLFSMGNADQLADILMQCASNPAIINDMRAACLQKAKEYTPETVIKVLSSEIV